jgi:hypothetical protein
LQLLTPFCLFVVYTSLTILEGASMPRHLLTLPLFFLLAAGGCGAAGGPESVAENFWAAIMAGDKEEARKYAAKDSVAELELEPKQPGEERDIEFGKAVESNNQVSIPTTMITTTNGQEQRVPLNTVLVKQDGDWKVDWNQTMASMLGGMMGEMMKGMSEAMEGMAEEMGKSFEEMGKSYEEAMKAPPPE